MKKLYSFALAALVALSAAAAPATKVTATRTLDTRSVMQAVESSRTFKTLETSDLQRMKAPRSAKSLLNAKKAASRADEEPTAPVRPDFKTLEFGDWADAGTCNVNLGTFIQVDDNDQIVQQYQIPPQEGVVMQERVCKTDANVKQFLLKGVSFGDEFETPVDLTLNCQFDENGEANVWFHTFIGQMSFRDENGGGVDYDVYFTDIYSMLMDGGYSLTAAQQTQYYGASSYRPLTGEFSLNALLSLPNTGSPRWSYWVETYRGAYVNRVGSEYKNLDFDIEDLEIVKENGKAYMKFNAGLNDLSFVRYAVKDAAYAQTTSTRTWAMGVAQGTDTDYKEITKDGEVKIEIPNAEKGYYYLYFLTAYGNSLESYGGVYAFYDPDWDFYGTATYFDPFCYGFFGLGTAAGPYIPELKVDVEKNNQKEGYYRIVSPYATFDGVRWDNDGPNLLLYYPLTEEEDNNLYFHVDDKGNAYIDSFTTGLIYAFLDSDNEQMEIPVTMGAMANDDIESEGSYDAAIAAYPEDFGTFKEGVLYFPCDMSEADKENSDYYTPLYFALTKDNSFNIFFDQPILKMDDSAIRDIVNDAAVDANAPVEYFNLQGIHVANPENGLYIRRQGRTVSKVLVK